MLFWPTVSAVGFVLLAGLVIALASSSTARYEFERNRVQSARQEVAVATTGDVPAGAGPLGGPVADPPGGTAAPSAGGAAQEMGSERGAAVGVANHPAGKRAVEPGAAPAWWLVEDLGDQLGDVLAGPSPTRSRPTGPH